MAEKREPDRAPSAPPGDFAAIDFETANPSRDSACAVGVVRVRAGAIAEKRHWLIRPPTDEFRFTSIHGIAWSHVRSAPTFATVWRDVAAFPSGIELLAAHNASFDRSVLHACARTAGLPAPPLPFTCTVQLAREHLGIYPTTLPDVCRHLQIPLRHHDALSDAEACAAASPSGVASSGPSFQKTRSKAMLKACSPLAFRSFSLT